MTATLEIVPSVLDRIRRTLVGLKMPRALEVLDQTVRQLERGEASALEVIDTLFAEELSLRENRRVKMALRMAKLSTVKTLTGFDFSFQPSLDRNRILALAQLDFIGHNEVIHFLGPPGTGKSHLATALGVEAVKAGRSVYFSSLADIISALAKAEREGQLRERIRFLCRTSLLIHHAVVIQIEGSSYRLRQHADLMPEHVRSKALINAPIPAQPRRRRGRQPKTGATDHPAG